jgi:hypothetical protein
MELYIVRKEPLKLDTELLTSYLHRLAFHYFPITSFLPSNSLKVRLRAA